MTSAAPRRDGSLGAVSEADHHLCVSPVVSVRHPVEVSAQVRPLQRLVQQRRAHPARGRHQQHPLQRLPGTQPVRTPVVRGAEQHERRMRFTGERGRCRRPPVRTEVPHGQPVQGVLRPRRRTRAEARRRTRAVRPPAALGRSSAVRAVPGLGLPRAAQHPVGRPLIRQVQPGAFGLGGLGQLREQGRGQRPFGEREEEGRDRSAPLRPGEALAAGNAERPAHEGTFGSSPRTIGTLRGPAGAGRVSGVRNERNVLRE
ncbi:hypothetical protein B0E37_02902 [Streptomyces sp. MH192]|nr:hypothetical protein [Streptomyces sp. MH192]MCF0097606.1 hypothetical protein [Streptomyces sp. MH191]